MSAIKSNGYTIFTGKTVFKSLQAFLAKNKHALRFILCDENTMQHCLPLLITSCPILADAEIIEIESGEASKSLEFSAHILQTLIEYKAGRSALVINLGGGVVSDLGGFTASIYKRGIDFINLPTSLLAMADASVGGKTGIDFGGIKNSVGTFAQPKAVFIYPGFLQTLPARHYNNGLAEIFKIALVADKKFWQELSKMSIKTNAETLLTKSIALKNKIVLKDPFDKGIRKILNFGHTIGHALESLYLDSAQELLHGEAIVIGMMIEAHLAFQKKLIAKKELAEICEVLTKTFKPAALPGLSAEAVLELAMNDKKISAKTLSFSLPDKTGHCKINVQASDAQVKKAMAYYNTLLA